MYDERERKSNGWGAAAVVLYLLACAGVMFVTYRISTPQPEALIVVDFGAGQSDAPAAEGATAPAAEAASAQPALPTLAAAPEIEPEGETVAEPKPEIEPQPQPPRRPNPQALFPGNAKAANESNSTSSTVAATGGVGSEGAGGVSLSGRYLVGSLPQPAYTVEVEGRVVISITVDAAGVVTGAVFEQSGSTTNNSQLVAAARAAAMRARFTADDATVQTGTITYIFKLNR